jgi:hypothetical protein
MHGELVCMNYLQAVFELDVMARHVALDGATVVEIGAGYGVRVTPSWPITT